MFFKKNKKEKIVEVIKESKDELELNAIINQSKIEETSQSNDDKFSINEKIEEAPPTSSKIISQYLKEIENFEADRILFVKKQNKIAWRVAIGASVITLFSLGAMISMLPLKTIVPYVIRVDNVTGEQDIINPLANGKDTYDEKLNKFWIQQFVMLRESYYWSDIKNTLAKVELLSTATIFDQYTYYLYGQNSPLNAFENNLSIRVDIKGTSFINTDGKVFAQTSFTKTVIDKKGQEMSLYPVTNWIATSTFDYKKEIKRKREEDINPLGFEITSYRVDPIK